MRAQLHVIIDDREGPAQDVRRLVGDIHFGDLLRRRRRYRDELTVAAAAADEVVVISSDEEAERLARRIETVRGETLWLRLPIIAAPLDIAKLPLLISKMRFAVEPTFLGPVLQDDAPMVLPARAMASLLRAPSPEDRRSQVLRLAEEAAVASHGVNFVDLRRPDALRLFLSGATEPRAFNRLAAEDGVFVKASEDVAKMRAEHDFFALAPPPMQRFLMPTFGYEDHADGTASYRMEHLRVPDAALQFVLGSFSQDGYTQLLDQFFAYLQARGQAPASVEAVREKGTAQILTKMHTRLADFAKTEEARRLEVYLATAGVEDGLSGLAARASVLIEAALARNGADYLAFSHGDPCLSNILYEERIGLMRLIDPRGARAWEDGLMHPLYDVAKFSHSVSGGYDFVNNELFSIEIDKELGLELHPHRGGPSEAGRQAFRERLEATGWSYGDVRAVEASLFLSMLPLHLDHPRKLLGYALIARDIIEELESLS